MFGTGTGDFSPSIELAAGTGTNSVAVADFNRDGLPDLAATNRGENTFGIFLGLGGARFGAQTRYPTAARPGTLVAVDLNGDSTPDLVFSNNGAQSLSVALGDSQGKFKAREDYPFSAAPNSVAAGDLNRDGVPDLAFGGVFAANSGRTIVLSTCLESSLVEPFHDGSRFRAQGHLRPAASLALDSIQIQGGGAGRTDLALSAGRSAQPRALSGF